MKNVSKNDPKLIWFIFGFVLKSSFLKIIIISFFNEPSKMPRRLKTEDVRKLFEKYGYTLPNDFQHRNTSTRIRVYDEQLQRYAMMSYQNLQYRIRSGRAEYEPPFEFYNMAMSDNEPSNHDSFNRWRNGRDGNIATYADDEQRAIFNYANEYIKLMMKHKPFSIRVDNNRQQLMHGFIEAAKIAAPKLGAYDIRLTMIDEHGHIEYAHLTPNTLKYFDDLFNNPNFEDVKTSMNDYKDSLFNLVELGVEFVKAKQGKRKVVGFFPFINSSDIDLSKYGIFNNINDERINESCLIQALEASQKLTDNEIRMLKSSIRTRMTPMTLLKEISSLLKVHIYVQYNDTHQDYGTEYKDIRSVRLFIMFDHYILNEKTNISKTYIERYNEINYDKRFMNHPRKMLLKKFDDKRYSFEKEGMKSVSLIRLMIEKGLLIPMNETQMNHLHWSFVPKEYSFDGFSRPVEVKTKTTNEYKRMHRIKPNHFLFGYHPNDDEIDERLDELQAVVDSLPLRNRVDVSLYYKFSELMQKIMFEYGCFDNVFEIAGDRAKEIRSRCIFPKTKTFNDKPLYLKQRMYYVDLNGAYMSAVESIPTGMNGDGEPNEKIKQLIQTLYQIRKRSNQKLSKTLKFMMNSCWGYSIQRPKTIKRKYSKKLEKDIETFAPYVYKYHFNNDGVSGYIHTVNSFVPHFTIPQFAKSVLDRFNEKMNHIKSLVHVYYENIDAVLIDENDYHKLVDMGFVGDELGQFKIERVFDEIAIMSPKRYVATLDNGERFYHCVSESIDYDAFVDEVKNNI